LLLLLLLSTKAGCVLRRLQTLHLVAVHLSSLKGLKLLHGVQLLAIHLRHDHLIGHLHQLRLVRIELEGPKGRDGLVHRALSSVAGLEALRLASIALVLVLALSAPVALEIPRAGPAMAAAASEVAGVTKATATTTTVDSHTLAPAMATTTAASGGGKRCQVRGCLCGRLVFIVGIVGVGARELETGRRSLLLGKFGGLLRIGKG
jgi:hypothetical protein